jgi:hypothetical protein
MDGCIDAQIMKGKVKEEEGRRRRRRKKEKNSSVCRSNILPFISEKLYRFFLCFSV